MTFVDKNFEELSRWDQIPNNNEINRIEETASLIPNEIESLLDVGCGNGIFTRYIQSTKSKIRFVSIDQSLAALGFVTTTKARGSINKLPFPSRSFDLVTCLEVIEHIPNPIYLEALSELCRVSKKYVLVSVPYEQNLHSMRVECPECFTIYHRYLHLRSFQIRTVENLLNDHRFESIKNIFIGEKLEYIHPIKELLELRIPPSKSICPVCGFNEISKTDQADNNPKNQSELTTITKKIIRKILLQSKKAKWIAALYQYNNTGSLLADFANKSY